MDAYTDRNTRTSTFYFAFQLEKTGPTITLTSETQHREGERIFKDILNELQETQLH